MAKRRQDPDDVPAGPKPPEPRREEGDDAASRQPPADGYLPDDSFLLDVDDEASGLPAPIAEVGEGAAGAAAGEEWILVDDDVVADEPAEARPIAAESTAEPVAAALPLEAASAQTRIPSWQTQDESALPAFVAEDREAAGAAAAIDAAPPAAPASEPGAGEAAAEAAELAPVVPLERARRRRIAIAAAGILIAVGGGAATWHFTRPGPDVGGSVEIAAGPRGPAPDADAVQPPPAPETEPAPEPVAVAPDPLPEPVPAPLPEPVPEPPPPLPPVEAAKPAPRPTTALVPVAPDPGRKRPLPSLSAAPRAAPPGPKSDTIVELRNGHTFRGQISRVRGSRVSLRIGSGECVFDLADVTLLDSTAPEYRRIDQMPEASVILRSGQHLRGRLMKQTDSHVVLVVKNGQLIFPRADIRDVSFTGRIHF